MADIPVNASDAVTIVAVTVNGQVNFDYDFRADFVADLKAEYRPANGGPVTVLVGGLDFTATGLGTAGGGTITLLAFVTVDGDSMAIYRDITVERGTDYTRDLFSDDINAEQDRIFMVMQELVRDMDRAHKAPLGGEGGEFTADDIQDAEEAAEAAIAAAASINQRIYSSVALASADNIPPVVKRLQTQFRAPLYAVPATLVGGANHRRASLTELTGYPAASFFRSVDRFMPDGTVDAVNGGYWVLDEQEANALHLGAIPDCTGVGVGTDVMPALEAAINFGVKRFGDGARIVLPAGRYRATAPKIIDLAAKHQVSIFCEGSITPDNVAMTMLTLRNAYDLALTANLLLGGVFNGWAAPSPYNVDYSTTADVVGGGGQEAFKIQGVFGFRVELKAYGYAGRVLRTTKPADVGHPDTGAISGWIETGRSMNFSEARVAQSLWADYGDVIGHGNWGALDRLAIDFDYYPPVWNDLNDIEIAALDSAFATGGPIFNGCVVVKGDDWYVGDLDAAGTKRHVVFQQSASRICLSVNVTKMRFLNAGTGLYCNGVKSLKTSIEYSAGVTLPFTSAFEGNNIADCDVRVVGNGYGERLAKVSGASSDNIKLRVDEWDFIASDNVIDLAADVGGSVVIIEPALTHAPAGKARIAVAGSGVVLVLDPVIRGATGYVFDIALDGNNVFVKGGHYSGTATLNKTKAPRELSGVLGVSGYDFGNRRINDGGNAGGAGGALDFGIGASGLGDYAPMARIKSKLQNATPNELQGSLAFQIRPPGAAGQALEEALELIHTTTDNETVGVLLMRIAGVMVAKRIKAGGASGAAVAGRILFVDN